MILDLRYTKISNRLIIIGLILAVVLAIAGRGFITIPYVLWNISFPVILLYPFFLTGALGAGDIKLFSVIGAFTNFKFTLCCIGCSLLFGAVISLVKLTITGRLTKGITEAGVYLHSLLMGKKGNYRIQTKEQNNRIHFSIPIGIGVLFVHLWMLLC